MLALYFSESRGCTGNSSVRFSLGGAYAITSSPVLPSYHSSNDIDDVPKLTRIELLTFVLGYSLG